MFSGSRVRPERSQEPSPGCNPGAWIASPSPLHPAGVQERSAAALQAASGNRRPWGSPQTKRQGPYDDPHGGQVADRIMGVLSPFGRHCQPR